MRCANLFDKETQLSYAYKILDIERSNDEYTFKYDYTDCPDYKLDPNLMTFTIDGFRELSISDHNIG